MALSNGELPAIRTGLIALHKAASGIDGWDGKQGRTFIEVGEYGLALDSIAYAYLENNTPMPTDQFQIFEKLASAMELENDPEYDGVARIRVMRAASGISRPHAVDQARGCST
jgi:hypothetical protein